MSGKHRTAGTPARHRTLSSRLLPLGAAGGAVLIIVLAAVSLWGLPGSGSAAPASFGERATADRGSRDDVRATATASPTASPSPTTSPSAKPKPSNSPTVLSSGTCQASYYGSGNRTASGERFDPDALTAAHKTLPFNTRVKVTNPTSGKSVIVRINDRGPFVSGRCLDLTTAAFADIASLSSGVVTVRYEVLK